MALALSPVPPIVPERALHAGGKENYTIGLLTLSALASIVLIPLSIKVLERVFHVPLKMSPPDVALLALENILLPLAIGIAGHRSRPALAERVATWLNWVAVALLVVGVMAALYVTRRAAVSLIGNGTILAFAAFCAIGLAVGHVLGKPDGENQIVLALATATRHPAVALAIADTNFPKQDLVVGALVIFVCVNALISALYLVWRVPHRFERRRHV